MEQIVQSMREPVRQYAEFVRMLGDGATRSLTMVGAVVTPTFDPGRHAARSVLVVQSVDLTWLRRLGAQGPRLGRLGMAAPLVLTHRHLESSRDTFPLELIEIQQFHETVLGDDVFVPLTFEPRHVQLQCERELKTLSIGLRQGVLAASTSDRMLAAVEGEAIESLMRTLRGLLWLKGERKALAAPEVLDRLEGLLGRDLAGVRDAATADGAHDWNEFQRLYAEVEFLGERVNDV